MTTTITPRLHGQCAACARVEALRPDGTMSRHREPSRGSFSLHRPGYCGGAGKPPVPGSVETWLAAMDTAAEGRLARAITALDAARVARDEAADHRDEWRAWAARQRDKLARATLVDAAPASLPASTTPTPTA